MGRPKGAKNKTSSKTTGVSKLIKLVEQLVDRMDRLEARPEQNVVRTMPLSTSSNTQTTAPAKRENHFESMPEFDSCKDDSILDRKLWANRQPSPRRESVRMEDLICTKCLRTKRVNPQYEPNPFVCNDCLTTGGQR